ncbi:uncharacterized protein TNCV_3943361 [Trichonephila clavipes]|nr:uncharacterized protein TNCV_3943361 [Trichonephila clavipes]
MILLRLSVERDKTLVQLAHALSWPHKMQHQEGPEISQQVYLADMLYRDQTIKITASCDVWTMTKSVVSVAAIVDYNRCLTPRHRIKESLVVPLGFNSLCGFHILPKLIWCRSGWCIPRQSLCKHGPRVFDW